MSDDVKKMGLVALIVVIVAIAVWTGVRSLNPRAGAPPEARAHEMQEQFGKLLKQGNTGGAPGTMRPGGPPPGVPVPGGPGAPGTGNAPGGSSAAPGAA